MEDVKTMRHCWSNSFFGKALAGAALAAFLMFPAAPMVHADSCQRRIARADHRLHRSVSRYGYRSRQADHARHELREERERCWNSRHRWWDEHQRRWRTERDWDDHDHDHD
jgi:hypothetical protein